MNSELMFSSATPEWETPQAFFDALDAEFHFTLDPCSTDENAKCAKHYTKAQDGLAQDWTGETVYCNPPYGREMPKWIQKCYEHKNRGGGLRLC
jgi:site-specific DNA-methyltransferase (adenine-specific)